MQAWYRSLFSVFLSITLILAGSPIQLFLKAQANTPPEDERIGVVGGTAQVATEVSSEIDIEAEQEKANVDHLLKEQQEADELADKAKAEEEYQQSIAELRESFGQPGRREAHLDPFLVTRQTIIDDREENLNSVVKQRALDDYLDRIKDIELTIEEYNTLLLQLEAKISNIHNDVASTETALANSLDEKVKSILTRLETVKKAHGANSQEHKDVIAELGELRKALFNLNTNKATEAITSQKLEEYARIRLDIQSRIKLAQMEYEDVVKHDPREDKGLKIDYMIDKELSTRHYYGRKLRLTLESEGQILDEIRQEDYTQSLSPRFNKKGHSYSDVENVHFTIDDHKGRVMHKFLNPISGVTFFGNHLVFIESSPTSELGNTVKVRFIDLRFSKVNIGNAPLPVFTLPVNLESHDQTLTHENGYLKVGGQRLSIQQFEMMSQAQQVLFNVNVALVDPASYENARPLIKEVFEFFALSMESMDASFKAEMEKSIAATPYFQKLTSNMEARKALNPAKSKADITKALEDGQLSQVEFDQIKTAIGANESLVETNTALASGRGFMTRMNLLGHHIMNPRPEGSPKLFNALVMAAMPSSSDERARALSLTKGSFGARLAKYGAATGGVLLAASMLPDDYSFSLYQGFDLISATSQHFQGYLEHINYGGAYVDLAKDAFITSVTGWTYFFDSYLSDGKWTKFLYGLGQVLLVPVQLFAGIHFTTNTIKMANKTYKFRKLSTEDISYLKAFKAAADKDSKEYWSGLSEAETKSSGSKDVSEITDDEIVLLDEHIARLKDGREGITSVKRDLRQGKFGTKTALRNFATTMSGFGVVIKSAKATFAQIGKIVSRLNLTSEDSVLKAFARSYLSYSSLRSTFRTNALIWNFAFMIRSYAWSPSKWLLFVMYPDYFKVAVKSIPEVPNPTKDNPKNVIPGKQHFPSAYNGGLDTWLTKIKKLVKKLPSRNKDDETSRSEITAGQALAEVRNFEKEIIKLEIAAIEVAKNKAQMALIESIRDPERLMALFDSTQRQGEVSTGIRHLNDKKIKSLTKQERLFYQSYFTRTFDLLMQKSIQELTSFETEETNPAAFAREFKTRMMQEGMKLDVSHLSEENVKSLTVDAERLIDFTEVKEWAHNVSTKMDQFGTRFDTRLRHNVLQSMHPQNGQIKRFLKVSEKVNDPRAMERAMRSEISSLTTGIPLGIISALGLYAGVQTGVLMPFDANGLDTETHLNYMSRYLFYAGFIPGLVLSLLAHTWMKLQTDARIDSQGGFDQSMISNKDNKRGFWRYYLKNTFANPSNKWRDNHTYQLALIWSNIPAAAVTILVSNLYGLGRIDIETFLAQYFIIFATFLTGWNMKIGQGFELASSWISSKIPRGLRAHPKAQKYINESIQKRRMGFEFFENIYGIVVMENIAGDMLVLKDNVKHGTRAFIRMLFGGETPTTLIVNAANAASRAFNNLPGIEQIKNGVVKLFSNRYEAFERFPSRLEKVPGIPQVGENPSLPKNVLGEFFGKTLGLISTWGAMAVGPYAIVDYFQKRRENKLQTEGQDMAKRRGQMKELKGEAYNNPNEEKELEKYILSLFETLKQNNDAEVDVIHSDEVNKLVNAISSSFKKYNTKVVSENEELSKRFFDKFDSTIMAALADGKITQDELDQVQAAFGEHFEKTFTETLQTNEVTESESALAKPAVDVQANSCAEYLMAN